MQVAVQVAAIHANLRIEAEFRAGIVILVLSLGQNACEENSYSLEYVGKSYTARRELCLNIRVDVRKYHQRGKSGSGNPASQQVTPKGKGSLYGLPFLPGAYKSGTLRRNSHP